MANEKSTKDVASSLLDSVTHLKQKMQQIQDDTARLLNRNTSEVQKMSENINKNPIIFNLEKVISRNVDVLKKSGIDKDAPPFMQNYIAEQIIAENKLKSTKGNLTSSYVEEMDQSEEIDKATEQENLTPEEQKIADKKNKLLDKKMIKGLGATLKQRVFGQDETINLIVTTLTNAALNIQINKNKPAGCYFFAGPSGVGKTELAQSISDAIGVPILKINMGEYSLEQDITKLIGTSKGYVGYNEGGLLTNFVSKNPKCIVLFDEIEKAHPSMDKILLSIMDHGSCTDNKGVNVVFKNTIIISTSNIGAKIEYDTTLDKETKARLRQEAIKEKISPEIINRYDKMFDFNSLSKDNYKLVINKFLTQLSTSMLEEHEFSLTVTPKLVDFIVEKSYDPAMGGRPARRFIEQVVIQKLAESMLEDEFEDIAKAAKEITLDLNKDNNIIFRAKRKILGILENTTDLVAEIERKQFDNPEVKKTKNRLG